MQQDILIAGAGFSGAVVARRLADQGFRVTVVDQRDHVAGNCHTATDSQTGVMMHVYGPHIFHTDSERVWNYIGEFGEMVPFVLRIKTTVNGRVFLLPINLHTINQFFGQTWSPAEAQAAIAAKAEKISSPSNFEEQALAFVGRELYEAFFKGYTEKQWGESPTQIPASVLKRLPLRFNYDDNYFNHPYQGIPRHGYTRIVENILDHPGISVELSTAFDPARARHADHVFYTGALDGFFGHNLGRLRYRTLDFEHICSELDDYQGCPLMNYPAEDIPYTRINEHKHYAPWMTDTRGTVVSKEFPRECQPSDVPYYPLRTVEDKELLARYRVQAEELETVTFLGRLGTYSYLDMDKTILRALETADGFLASHANGQRPQAFYHA